MNLPILDMVKHSRKIGHHSAGKISTRAAPDWSPPPWPSSRPISCEIWYQSCWLRFNRSRQVFLSIVTEFVSPDFGLICSPGTARIRCQGSVFPPSFRNSVFALHVQIIHSSCAALRVDLASRPFWGPFFRSLFPVEMHAPATCLLFPFWEAVAFVSVAIRTMAVSQPLYYVSSR